MTFEEAKAYLNMLGFTLRKKEGRYRVNFRSYPEAWAYYTSDLQDAMDAGPRMEQKEDDRKREVRSWRQQPVRVPVSSTFSHGRYEAESVPTGRRLKHKRYRGFSFREDKHYRNTIWLIGPAYDEGIGLAVTHSLEEAKEYVDRLLRGETVTIDKTPYLMEQWDRFVEYVNEMARV